jgi:ribosome-associated protein
MSRVREVVIKEEPIRLGQFLKLAGLADDGSHARALIEAGDVTVNGEAEHRRARQLMGGDVVAVECEQFRVVTG